MSKKNKVIRASIITPIRLGAGIGEFVVQWPAGGEVVHGSLDFTGAVILWVRHQVDASMLRKAFLLEAAGREFDSEDEVVAVVQFEIEQPADKEIVVPGEAEGQPTVKQILIFVIDAGVTAEETVDEVIG